MMRIWIVDEATGELLWYCETSTRAVIPGFVPQRVTAVIGYPDGSMVACDSTNTLIHSSGPR